MSHRSIPITQLLELRENYLAADETFTKLVLLDTQIEMTKSARAILHNKARRLQISMLALGLAAVLIAIGVGVR